MTAGTLFRVTAGMAASDGSAMLKKKVWAVVGNHGKNPVVGQLTERLRSHGKEVFRVNPYNKPPAEFSSLKDLPDPESVECVDLVVNPTMGMDVVEQMAALGIRNLFVQPGAGSQELSSRCEELGIAVHEGCVLVELPAGRL